MLTNLLSQNDIKKLFDQNCCYLDVDVIPEQIVTKLFKPIIINEMKKLEHKITQAGQSGKYFNYWTIPSKNKKIKAYYYQGFAYLAFLHNAFLLSEQK